MVWINILTYTVRILRVLSSVSGRTRMLTFHIWILDISRFQDRPQITVWFAFALWLIAGNTLIMKC